MISRRPFLTAGAACVLSVAAGSALAQSYPSRVVRIMVPAGPGGPTDVFARLIAQKIGPVLGGEVIVENRPGAGGAIAAKFVASSPPDGYTLMLGNTSTLATIPAFAKTPDYDPVAAFAPVANIAESFSVLAMRADSPVNSVKELVAHAKANPRKLNFGSAGQGNFTHLVAELFKLRAEIEMVHIPFRGVADAANAMLAGQVDLIFGNQNVTVPQVEAGNFKALAVTSAARAKNLPNVPTMKEAGMDDFVVTSFFGIVAPAGTDPAIVGKLNAAINDALKTPEINASIIKLGSEPSIMSPQDFAALIASDFRRWTAVAKAPGMKVE